MEGIILTTTVATMEADIRQYTVQQPAATWDIALPTLAGVREMADCQTDTLKPLVQHHLVLVAHGNQQQEDRTTPTTVLIHLAVQTHLAVQNPHASIRVLPVARKAVSVETGTMAEVAHAAVEVAAEALAVVLVAAAEVRTAAEALAVVLAAAAEIHTAAEALAEVEAHAEVEVSAVAALVAAGADSIFPIGEYQKLETID